MLAALAQVYQEHYKDPISTFVLDFLVHMGSTNSRITFYQDDCTKNADRSLCSLRSPGSYINICIGLLGTLAWIFLRGVHFVGIAPLWGNCYAILLPKGGSYKEP